MNWGEALRAFRVRNNIKQETAAQMLGISQAYVSRLESGTYRPSEEVELKLRSLVSEPAYRPIFDGIRALVSHSPHIMYLLSQRDGHVWVEAASESALRMSTQLDQNAPRLIVGQPIALNERKGAIEGVQRMVAEGGFKGKLSFIDAVWTSRFLHNNKQQYMRNTLIPLRDETGLWYIHGTTRNISEIELNKLKIEWDGSILCGLF